MLIIISIIIYYVCIIYKQAISFHHQCYGSIVRLLISRKKREKDFSPLSCYEHYC